MSTLEVLRDARNLIAEHGWIQGSYGNPECGFCADGALMKASGGGDEWDTAYNAFVAQLPEEEARYGLYIPRWNDMPGRTVDDVLAVFDKAIQAEEQK